jgi:hypothetical protein
VNCKSPVRRFLSSPPSLSHLPVPSLPFVREFVP